MMPLTAESLQKIHRLHQQVADLHEQLEMGPRKLTSKRNELAGADQLQLDLKEQVTLLKVKADEKQLDGREREARIVDLRAKLNVCSTNKEYQILAEEIASNQATISQIDDEIFALLEEVDGQEQKRAEAAEHRAGVLAALEQLQGEVEASQKQLKEELERVQGELKEAEAQLPEDFRQDYDYLAETRGQGALAAVEDECCCGCYQKITPQMINELYLAKPVFCKSCGCLLYLPEGEALNESSDS
jgi:predicted  nucleic acid-binding Zn-ribbon protein